MALVANEFRGLTFTCNDNEKTTDGVCLIPDGDAALVNFGIGQVDIGVNVAITLALAVAMRILAFISLKYLHNNKPFFSRKKKYKYVFLQESSATA